MEQILLAEQRMVQAKRVCFAWDIWATDRQPSWSWVTWNKNSRRKSGEVRPLCVRRCKKAPSGRASYTAKALLKLGIPSRWEIPAVSARSVVKQWVQRGRQMRPGAWKGNVDLNTDYVPETHRWGRHYGPCDNDEMTFAIKYRVMKKMCENRSASARLSCERKKANR